MKRRLLGIKSTFVSLGLVAGIILSAGCATEPDGDAAEEEADTAEAPAELRAEYCSYSLCLQSCASCPACQGSKTCEQICAACVWE